MCLLLLRVVEARVLLRELRLVAIGFEQVVDVASYLEASSREVMKWHASEEHDTLGVELTEVSSHSTPSLRHGVAWCARRHTSIRFVEGSGLSPVRNIPDDEKLRERRQETALSA